MCPYKIVDFLCLKNFIDLYFSPSHTPANSLLKRIPVEQIDYIMSLEGFLHAKYEVDVVNNYVTEKAPNQEQDENQSLQSRESISVGNFIFTENILTYDTFLTLLDDGVKNQRKQSLDSMMNGPSTVDPNSKNSSNLDKNGAGQPLAQEDA